MTFGTAILAAPKARKACGSVYDCGKHGKLTVGQIAKLAGIAPESVRFRIKAGWKREELCAPYRVNHRRKPGSSCRHPTIAIAVQLAKAFPNHAPTTKEIMAVRPMSRNSASRWRQAFRDVVEGI